MQPNILASPTIIAFLTGISVPAAFRFVLDQLDVISTIHLHNIHLLRVVVVVRFVTYILSFPLCVAFIAYAKLNPSEHSLDIGCAAVATIISIYAWNFSLSSSIRLYTLLRWPATSISSQSRDLLPFALKKLTPLAINSDLWTVLPFKEFLDLLSFCLQLGEGPLLDTLFSAETSWVTTTKLRQLQKRLPPFQRLHRCRKALVSYAFGQLVRHALTQHSPSKLPFPVRADLATYCMDLGDRQLVETVCRPDLASAPACASRLSQLQERLPDRSALSQTGRRYLRAALHDLLALACEEDRARSRAYSVAFPVQVELVMLYLREVGRRQRSDHISIWVGSETERMQAIVVHDGEEGHWIRAWVHRFHNAHTMGGSNDERSSPQSPMDYATYVPKYSLSGCSGEEDVEEVIRRVVVLYGRIKSAASSHADAQHIRTYRHLMQ